MSGTGLYRVANQRQGGDKAKKPVVVKKDD